MEISKEFLNYSRKTGSSGENLFSKVAKDRGFSVKNPTEDENMKSHIDFWITKNGKTNSVDVKGLKKSIDDGEVWIEFKNVRGDNGWLYGDADFIAFQLQDSFLLVNRLSLIDIVESKVNFNVYADKQNALYKLYTRGHRDDQLTKIKVDDLFECKFKKWMI